MSQHIAWNEYEFSRREPALPRGYPAPEEEDQLLDGSVFLKSQVWHRMNRIRWQTAHNKNAGKITRKPHTAGRRRI